MHKRDYEQAFQRKIAAKEKTLIRAKGRCKEYTWFGFGMFGLIGWSIVTPSLLGLALGYWIDSKWETGYSWSLMLFFGGLMLGCFNAWYWITKERKSIEEENKR